MSTFKERGSSTLTDETCENSPLFVSCHHYFASFGVCMFHIQFIFELVRNQTSNKTYLLELKEDEKF